MSDHFAKEAQRLLNDDVLKQAFEAVRQDALEALAMAKADDITAVLRLQAQVAAIEEVRASLKAMIIRQGQSAEKASPFA
jgi:hypothetical protein